jgi:hypothetical protein
VDLGVGTHLDTVRIARGSLYLDRELCERYLTRVASVALMLRDGRIVLLPLHGTPGGGLLLKVRNARGDRVIHAPDFLRSLGIEESAAEFRLPARWDDGAAGLILDRAETE